MTGVHHVRVSRARVVYEFDLLRNITMIRGASANGKTSLFDMIEYYSTEKDSNKMAKVSISCDKPCIALHKFDWRDRIPKIRDSIIFMDENGVERGDEVEFAGLVKNSDNYYVIISREDIKYLPYSITEIYTIRESKHYGGIQGVFDEPDTTYNEFSRVYDGNGLSIPNVKRGIAITEDSGAGHEMFKKALPNCIVETAGGKNNIGRKLAVHAGEGAVAIVDGVAFGPEIQTIINYMKIDKTALLYAPESFEYLLLNLRIFRSIKDKLENTADYAESSKYLTWEQYYEDLLKQELNKLGIKYDKGKLPKQLLSDATIAEFKDLLPDIFK